MYRDVRIVDGKAQELVSARELCELGDPFDHKTRALAMDAYWVDQSLVIKAREAYRGHTSQD